MNRFACAIASCALMLASTVSAQQTSEVQPAQPDQGAAGAGGQAPQTTSTAKDTGNIEREATTNTPAIGPAEQFGEKESMAVASDAAFTIQRSNTSGAGGTTTISLAPSFDYFPGTNISVGGFIGFDYTHAGSSHSTRFAIGPRVGYNWVLSDSVSIWPKAGLSLAATNAKSGGSSSSDTTIAVNLFVPIMFHPATHFFIGFGPFLDADLSGDARTTVFGGRLTVGGWLRP